MSVVVVIPARYASTRLPGKPLLKIGAKTIIQMAYEQAKKARSVDRVIVATDDERIREAVTAFGGEVRMTRADHPCGTNRVAEVVEGLPPDVEIVVNLQGDEPDILPEQVDAVVRLLREDEEAVMSTLVVSVQDREAMEDPNQVKVVCDARGRALYFTRAPVPFTREASQRDWRFMRHLGIYAFRRDFLLRYASMDPTPLERKEKLEQLRALENGCIIRVGITDHATTGIDTREDYEKFLKGKHEIRNSKFETNSKFE